jgi:hypothetical protein
MAPLPGSEDYREPMVTGSRDTAPPVPIDDEEIAVEEIEEEATSRVELPVEALPAPAATIAPVFSHAPRQPTEAAQRRQRRLVAILSAAAVFGVLATVAVVTVQPVALMRSSSALRPDTTSNANAAHALSTTGAVAASKPTVPVAAQEETPRTLERTAAAELPIAGGLVAAPATVTATAPERHAAPAPATIPKASLVAPASASTTASGSSVASGSVASGSVASGSVAGGSVAGGSVAGGSVASVPKRATKHPQPVARRARAVAPIAKATIAAPAPAPAASSSASAKVDCKQPFWIDEKGIRRLKLACL